MKLADFQTDRNGNPYGLKKCKYHCDYGDGEYCHYNEIDGCIYNKTKEEIDGQIKGRRMTDAESMGMLFDDPLDLPRGVLRNGQRECNHAFADHSHMGRVRP